MLKKLQKLIADRRFVGGVLLALQAAAVICVIAFVSLNWMWVYRMCTILSAIIVIWLIRKYDNPAYKIPWIVLILLFPIFGGLFYLFWGNTPFNRNRARHRQRLRHPDFSAVPEPPASEEMATALQRYTRGARYIQNESAMPVWGDTATTYYPIGEKQFAAMCEALESAQHFIFMEYFIIEPGKMWDTLLDILVRKVREGCEVRVMYDDAAASARSRTAMTNTCARWASTPCVLTASFPP